MSSEIVPFVDGNDTPSAQPHHNTNWKVAVEDLHCVSIEKDERLERTKPNNTGREKVVVGAMEEDVRPFDLLGLRSVGMFDYGVDLIGGNHYMRHFLTPKKGPKCLTKFNPSPDFVKHLLDKIKEPIILQLQSCDQLFSSNASLFPFEKLKTLICLQISGVSSLISFPENTITEMTQLQILNLSHLPNLQQPPDFFSKPVHLRSFTLKDCPSIHSLPKLTQMTTLEYLELSYLLIATLPEEFFNYGLKELKRLILRGCSKLSSLPSFNPLNKLEELDLSHCTAFQEIELEDPWDIQKLDLSYTAFHKLYITELHSNGITHLFLRDAKVIDFLAPYSLFNLRVLDASGAQYVKNLDLLSKSRKLEALDLSRTRIESIDFISFMENLRYLILRDCTRLQKLPTMAKLTHLEVLDISGCEILGDLPVDFSSLKNLKELNLSGCSGLKELSPSLFNGMTSLEKVDISKTNINHLSSFAGLTNLRILNIKEVATCLQTITNLDTLDVVVAPESRIENLHPRLPKPSKFYIVSSFFINSGFDRFQQHYHVIVDLIKRFHEGFKQHYHVVVSLYTIPIPYDSYEGGSLIQGYDDSTTKTDAESCPISGQTIKMQCSRMVADLEYIRANIGLLESCPNSTSAERLLDELMDGRSQFKPLVYRHDSSDDFYARLDSTNFYEVLRRITNLKQLVPRKQVDALEEKKNKEKKTLDSSLYDEEEQDVIYININTPAMQNLSRSYESLTKTQKNCLLHFTVFRANTDIKERMLIELSYGEGLIDPQHQENPNSSANPLPTPNQNLNLDPATADSDPNQEITNASIEAGTTSTTFWQKIEEIGQKILMVLQEKNFIIRDQKREENYFIRKFRSEFPKASPFWSVSSEVQSFLRERAMAEDFSSVDRETRMLIPHLSTSSQRAYLLIPYNNLPSSCKLWADYLNSSEKMECFKTIRTLLNVNADIVDINVEWFSKMRNLSVFHLGRCRNLHKPIDQVRDLKFLEELKNMKKLRLLNLDGFLAIKKLPDSVCKVTNLRILNLRGCGYLEELPAGIGSLNNLIHLDLTDCPVLCMLPKGIRLLSNLEVLKGFVIYYQIGGRQHRNACTLRDLLKLEKLRILKLVVHREKFPSSSDLHVFNRMKNLCSLRITWQKNYNDSDEQSEDTVGQKASSSSRWHQLKCWEQQRSENEKEELLLRSNIKKLELRCFPLETAPNWLTPGGLQKLEKLCVRGGKLKTLARNTDEDKWSTVKMLRLRYLGNMYMDGKEFRCNFPHLEYFEAYLCDQLPDNFMTGEIKRTSEGLKIGKFPSPGDPPKLKIPYTILLYLLKRRD